MPGGMTAEQHSTEKTRKLYLLMLYRHSFWLDEDDKMHGPAELYMNPFRSNGSAGLARAPWNRQQATAVFAKHVQIALSLALGAKACDHEHHMVPFAPQKNAHSPLWVSVVLRGQSNVNTLYNLMHLSEEHLKNELGNVAIQLKAYALDSEQLAWLIPLYNCIFFALQSIGTPCLRSHHIDEIMATHRFCTAPGPVHGVDTTQKTLLLPLHMLQFPPAFLRGVLFSETAAPVF